MLLIGKLFPPTHESQPHTSLFDLAHQPGLFTSFEAVYKTLNEQPSHVIEFFYSFLNQFSPLMLSPSLCLLSSLLFPIFTCLYQPLPLSLPSSSLTRCSLRLSFLLWFFYPHLPSVRFINQWVAPLYGSLGSNQIHFGIECV